MLVSTRITEEFAGTRRLKELVNHLDIRGNPPLFLAIYLKNHLNDDDYLKIIELLLKNKADPNIKNDFILSPTDQAILSVKKFLYDRKILPRYF